MFGKSKKETEKVTVVTTKEQLKAAIKRKDACIEVQGELVKKMKWMAKLSPKKIAAIIACLTAATAASTVVATAASTAAPPATPIVVPTVKYAVESTTLAAAGIGALDAASIIKIIEILGVVIVIAILKGYNVELKEGDKSLRLTANK